jgi:cytochrome b561
MAKWLHWLVALWFLAAYIIIYYLEWVLGGAEQPLRGQMINYHKAVGFSVLILFVIRVYWRAINPAPKHPENMPHWQVMASHVTHYSLYFFMIAMPISGYIGNGSGIKYGLFKITPFKDTAAAHWILDVLGVTYEQFEIPFDTFHYSIAGPYILSALIFLHAGAAIYHHVVQKDDVLRRMLPEKN